MDLKANKTIRGSKKPKFAPEPQISAVTKMPNEEGGCHRQNPILGSSRPSARSVTEAKPLREGACWKPVGCFACEHLVASDLTWAGHPPPTSVTSSNCDWVFRGTSVLNIASGDRLIGD